MGERRGIAYFACLLLCGTDLDAFTCFSTFGIQTSRLPAANENLLKISPSLHAHGKSRSVNFPIKSILTSSNLAHYLLAKNE